MIPQNPDRDLLIRVDADLKNLDSRVKDVSELQSKHGARTESLAESMLQLTYNVGALVKGMEKAETGLHGLSQQGTRISDLEAHATKNDEINAEFRKDTTHRLAEMEQKFDRGFFLAKIVTGIIGSPVAIAACLWVLQFVQAHVK